MARKRSNTPKKSKARVVDYSHTRLLFVNKGRVIALDVDYPKELPLHKIKEVFNQEFVGNKEDVIAIKDTFTGFTKLDDQIKWTLSEMKKKED